MVSINGFGVQCLTLKNAGGAFCDGNIGDFVKLCYDGTVQVIESGQFFGVITAVNDYYYTIQVAGYVEVNYSGPALPNYARLIGKTANSVENSTENVPYRTVVWQDSNKGRIGIIL